MNSCKLITLFVITILFIKCQSFSPLNLKQNKVIILDFVPDKANCELVKNFEITSFYFKLANVIKYGRNDARIKANNLGASYIVIVDSKVNHHRSLDIFKRDKYEFLLNVNAYKCKTPIKRQYKTQNKPINVNFKDVVILENHIPVKTYCTFVKDIYFNNKPNKYKDAATLKIDIKNHIKTEGAKAGANLIKPNMTPFSHYSGEYVVYAKGYWCKKIYIDFLKEKGF